jgi:signal transduction histidine kinase
MAHHHHLPEDFRDLSHRILDHSNLGIPRMDFLKEIANMLLDFSECDLVELRVRKEDACIRCEARRQTVRLRIVPCEEIRESKTDPCLGRVSGTEHVCRSVVSGPFDSSSSVFTAKGSFWTGDVEKLRGLPSSDREVTLLQNLGLSGPYRSLALIPLGVGKENTGLLQLKSKNRYFFTQNEIESYEGIAQTLGIALAHQLAQAALRERIKELTCLYGIAKLVERPGISLEETLEGIVQLLPPAWQYPDISSARIVLDGKSYSTAGFRNGRYRQTADIAVNGKLRGSVTVVYARKQPELYEGPFLSEERSLIDTVARQVALIIEQRQAEEESTKLEDQLRHADRLATIGQLAAGVAHELNEPLANILGFAQLTSKTPDLPTDVTRDLEKIINASLYAREVIRKLMLFARQMPPQRTRVDINQLIEEGLSLFESRCAKEGIELVRSLSPNLPKITADPGQLTQVMVNLAVNSIQAMPTGGMLTLQTVAGDGHVSLIVEDTGEGMSPDTLKKIFLPFFTTKGTGQGTGLGLAVVHGIVSAHKGSIKVKSKPGQGSRFEIELPLSAQENG